MLAALSPFLTGIPQRVAQVWRALVPASNAATFGGGGLDGGVDQAGEIGVPNVDLRDLIIHIIEIVLNFVAIIAVAVVIYAGILLIISLGDDTRKDQAKKAILYMAIGLVIIILSRIIVSIVLLLATVP
ncbi:MAG: hypothetical protein AAB728_06050 [Patescibacteria group bacterium]